MEHPNDTSEPIDMVDTGIASRYGLPAQLAPFIDMGFLQVLSEDPARRTLEFHIPSKRMTDTRGGVMAYSVIWIHPDFNDQYCHFYVERPGDLPNFYVTKEFTDSAEEPIDGLDDVDDLVEWLTRLESADIA